MGPGTDAKSLAPFSPSPLLFLLLTLLFGPQRRLACCLNATEYEPDPSYETFTLAWALTSAVARRGKGTEASRLSTSSIARSFAGLHTSPSDGMPSKADPSGFASPSATSGAVWTRALQNRQSISRRRGSSGPGQSLVIQCSAVGWVFCRRRWAALREWAWGLSSRHRFSDH